MRESKNKKVTESLRSIAVKGKEKEALKKKLGKKCVYCGCTNELILTIDHSTPRSRGGKDTEKNKKICCWTCNQLKGSLTHKEFKQYLKALFILKDLRKVKLTYSTNRVNLDFYPNRYPEFGLHFKEEKDGSKPPMSQVQKDSQE